jgi:DNA-binding NarL/FixJ family response regulator
MGSTTGTVGSGRARVAVLVVDDHPVVSAGVATVLRSSPVSVVGQAASADEACRLAAELRPDVVLLDLRLDDELGSDVVAPLLAAAPRAKVVLFTAFPEHLAVASAIAAGAVGCLVKDVSRTHLVEALLAVADGRALPPPAGAGAKEAAGTLSAREFDILRRVAVGQTNAEIAAELFLAPTTVKTYWQSALSKLRARNRAEAITKAYRMGLL